MRYLFLLLPMGLNAQTTDSLTNARAYKGSFLPIYNSGLSYLQSGYTTNGHIWMAGFNLRFSGNSALPAELVRIDITDGTTTSKIIDSITSSTTMIWRNVFDSSGNLYLGLDSRNRRIWKFNFKDSIYAENLGNGFRDGLSLAYSIALGRDKNMYFGSSSGAGPSVSYYNTTTRTITSYAVIDDFQDYTLSVLGDSNWIYAQVGQRSYNSIWAIRKSDGYKKKLDSVPSSTLFNTGIYKEGVYIQKGSTWYKATDSALVPSSAPVGRRIDYYETANGVNSGPVGPLVTSFYDYSSSLLMYNVDNTSGVIPISSSVLLSTVRRVFTDYTDTTKIYYFGEEYGYCYRYNLLTNDTTKLGYIGFNVYSWVQYNDSLFYVGGYPSGVVALYNKNQPWTAETFYSGSMHHLSTSTNPKLIVYFRSGTPAEFHHTYKMIKTTDGYIVAEGSVIRTNLTASVGVINPVSNTAWGYDADKMPRNMGIVDIAQWRDKVLITTINNDSTGAKIYVYDYRNNLMTDSMTLGYYDYGKAYVCGDKLIGVGNNKIYNYNLATKRLVNSHIYANGAISFSYQMPDGRILIKSTGITLPTDMSYDFVTYTGTQLYNMSTSGSKLYAVANNGLEVLRLNNYFRTDCGLQNVIYAVNMISARLSLPTRATASTLNINGQ